MKIQLKQIIKIIKKSSRVAVFAHLSADPDCLGSQSAISFLCQMLGKQVDCYIDDDKIPSNCNFMDLNINLGKIFEPNDYDLLITVDISACKMLGKYYDAFNNHNNTIEIDHHKVRDLQAKYSYIDFNSASCAEIIYDLIKLSKIKLTKQIATNIYSGIAGDTGCFLHDNTTKNSHMVAGELIELGADISTANYNLFKLTTKKEFKLNSILDKEMVQKNNVTYCIVEQELLSKNGYLIDDVSGGYVNKLINLENTNIAYLIKEKEKDKFTVSLRSLNGYDVSKIAKIFGGGGHKQAAGFFYEGKLKDFSQQLLFECQKEAKKVEEDVF